MPRLSHWYPAGIGPLGNNGGCSGVTDFSGTASCSYTVFNNFGAIDIDVIFTYNSQQYKMTTGFKP